MTQIIYWLIVFLLLFTGKDEIIRIPFNSAFGVNSNELIIEIGKRLFAIRYY